jgi:hypothetical protein
MPLRARRVATPPCRFHAARRLACEPACEPIGAPRRPTFPSGTQVQKSLAAFFTKTTSGYEFGMCSGTVASMRWSKVLRFLLLGAVALGSLCESGAAAAARQRVVAERCEWSKPGHDPFMGDVVGAVDRYTDLPVDVRSRLKARMIKREYDEIVVIRRDSIVGKATYSPSIRDMHFGPKNRVCKQVTRTRWTSKMQERGLVYCEDRQCILVPTVCRNVSRIVRASVANEQARGPGGGAALPEFDLSALPPTSAGNPTAQPLAAGASPEGSSAFGPAGPANASSISITAPAGGVPPTSFAPGGFDGPFTGPGPVAVVPAIGGPVLILPPIAPVNGVPEPTSALLWLVGLAALGCAVRRRGIARRDQEPPDRRT